MWSLLISFIFIVLTLVIKHIPFSAAAFFFQTVFFGGPLYSIEEKNQQYFCKVTLKGGPGKLLRTECALVLAPFSRALRQHDDLVHNGGVLLCPAVPWLAPVFLFIAFT